MFLRILLAFALALTASSAGAAQGQEAGEPAQEYALGVGDVVEVGVLGREEFKTRARIRPDGTVLLPFLGEVAAASLTPTEFSASVAAALQRGQIYADPAVVVDVVSYASQYVIVLGAVAKPGLVPIDRAYRLSEILARVGGAEPGGAGYVVLTPASGAERRYTIERLATGAANEDPLVAPGDKIYAPEAKLFYIYGEVNSPGAFPMMTEPTVRKALAQGGGIKPTGTHRKVTVFRGGERLKGLELSQPIQPGDVIVVGERLF